VRSPSQLTLDAPAARAIQDPEKRLLDVSTIYLEQAVLDHRRGVEILGRYPDAERVEVDSHWRIPGLFGNEGNVERWNEIAASIRRHTGRQGVKPDPNQVDPRLWVYDIGADPCRPGLTGEVAIAPIDRRLPA
jgi:hypothetical protein